MRQKTSIAVMIAALLVVAIALVAASPSPSASPHASPSASPHPSASPTPSASPRPSASPTPSASPSPTPSASAEPTFSAKVKPLEITGTATVVQEPNGTGTVTLKVSGLLDAQHWSVDMDGGTVARPNENVGVAFKTGADVTRLAMDTIRINLTEAEMDTFTHALSHGGVVAQVSDGARIGYAEFTAG